jgi:hypothetical protein
MGGECSAYEGEERLIQGMWWGNLIEREDMGDPSVDGRIILRWIFRQWDVWVWIGSSWLKIGIGGRHLGMQ